MQFDINAILHSWWFWKCRLYRWWWSLSWLTRLQGTSKYLHSWDLHFLPGFISAAAWLALPAAWAEHPAACPCIVEDISYSHRASVLPLDNTNRSNPSFLFAWSLWGVDGLMRLTHLVTMIITVLLFLLVEGKSFDKPNLFLLPLVFGLFHTWNSVPCWGGTNSWEVLDFTPKSDSAFPVPDQTAAAFCASSVSSPQPTSHPQRPATQNNGSSW